MAIGPIGVIKFTKKNRRILTLAITVINLMQIIIGITLFIVGIYVTRSVGPKIFSERAEITYVFTVITMFGVSVIIQYVIGLNVCYRCYLKAHKKSTSSLLFIWSIAACNTIINGMVLAALAIKTSKHIVRSIRHSLRRGINKYLVDLTWKYTLDNLQQHSECCGITNSKDWIQNAWILTEFLNPNDEVVKSAQKSEKTTYLPVMPWSCCKMNYPLPCFHDQFQQKESLSVFKTNSDITENSIYSTGCLDILREPIENGLIIVVLADTTLLILQLLAMFMLRLLYTSSKNAVILEDEEGTAPGWLIGPKESQYASTLLNIMNIQVDQEIITKDIISEDEEGRMLAGSDSYTPGNSIYTNSSLNYWLLKKKLKTSRSSRRKLNSDSDCANMADKKCETIRESSNEIVQKLALKKNPNGSILIVPSNSIKKENIKLKARYKPIPITESKISGQDISLRMKRTKSRTSKEPVEDEEEMRLLLQ